MLFKFQVRRTVVETKEFRIGAESLEKAKEMATAHVAHWSSDWWNDWRRVESPFTTESAVNLTEQAREKKERKK